MTKYKILPNAPFIVYKFKDDINLSESRIEFGPDGRFYINGRQSKDYAELGKHMVEWILTYSEQQGYVEKIHNNCDCGAYISKTTCANWCSSKSKNTSP